jgi:hypothetical protein
MTTIRGYLANGMLYKLEIGILDLSPVTAAHNTFRNTARDKFESKIKRQRRYMHLIPAVFFYYSISIYRLFAWEHSYLYGYSEVVCYDILQLESTEMLPQANESLHNFCIIILCFSAPCQNFSSTCVTLSRYRFQTFEKIKLPIP